MRRDALLEKLRNIGKAYYTAADIGKITGQNRRSVLVMLNRLARSGNLIRLRKNFYALSGQKINYELIAQQIDPESYLSFESALSRYGILSQIPYSLTLATPKRSRKLDLAGREIIYRKLKKGLFFGFVVEDNIRIASPEKAFLDLLYLVSRGQSGFNYQELDLAGLNKKKLFKTVQGFPSYTSDLLAKIFD